MNKKISILIIDDNQEMAARLAERLRSDTSVKSVECCGFSEREINKHFDSKSNNIVLLDMYDLKTIDQRKGIDLARNVGAVWRGKGVIAIILLTVLDSSDITEIGRLIKASIADGIVDAFIRKPSTSAEILQVIHSVILKKEAIQ